MAVLADIRSSLAGVDGLATDQRLQTLMQVRDQLTVLIGEELSEFSDAGGLADTRFSNPASWLASTANQSKGESSRIYHSGRLCNRYSAIANGVDEGFLTADHLKCLKKCLPTNRTRTRAELFELAHKHLVELARDLPYPDFVIACDTWIQAADDADPEAQAPEDKDLHIRLTDNKDGTTSLKGLVLTTDAEQFKAALKRLVEHAKHQHKAQTDTAAYPGFVNEDDTALNLSEYTLGPVVRKGVSYWMARALGELANRAHTAPANGKAPEPLVVITMDPATFDQEAERYAEWIDKGSMPPTDPLDIFRDSYLSQTLTGTPVRPADAFRNALKHRVARCIIDAESRKVDLGRSQRLFTGAARLAVMLRDRMCRGPGCDQAIDQIDHVEEWTDGGATNPANAEGLCNSCHRHKTRREHRRRQDDHERRTAEPF